MTVGIFCFLMGNSYVLTDHGQQMAGQCLGLKRYMQGFSNFKYRGVADLTLWDCIWSTLPHLAYPTG